MRPALTKILHSFLLPFALYRGTIMAIFQLSGTDAVFTQMLSKSPSHSISKPHLYFNITQITTGKADDHEPYDCALVAWQLIHENNPENLLQEQDKYNADTHPTAQHSKLCTYGHCPHIPLSEWRLVITYKKNLQPATVGVYA